MPMRRRGGDIGESGGGRNSLPKFRADWRHRIPFRPRGRRGPGRGGGTLHRPPSTPASKARGCSRSGAGVPELPRDARPHFTRHPLPREGTARVPQPAKAPAAAGPACRQPARTGGRPAAPWRLPTGRPMISSPSGRPVAVKPPHTTSDGTAATFATVVSSGREKPSSGRCSLSSGAAPWTGALISTSNFSKHLGGGGDQVGAAALGGDVVGRADQRAGQHADAEHPGILGQAGAQRGLVQRIGLGADDDPADRVVLLHRRQRRPPPPGSPVAAASSRFGPSSAASRAWPARRARRTAATGRRAGPSAAHRAPRA